MDISLYNISLIEFNNGTKFSIIHNLQEDSEKNIEEFTKRWSAVTKEHTAVSLCEFINSEPTCIALPENHFVDIMALANEYQEEKIEEAIQNKESSFRFTDNTEIPIALAELILKQIKLHRSLKN